MNNKDTDPYERNIPNTFLPDCRNKMLSVDDLIAGLRVGIISFDVISPEISERVHLEIEKRFRGKDKSPIRP